jgi:predicted small metal-binding protein
MKTFACGAVVPGCTATFTAESEEGILEQVARHARDDHDLPEVPEELVRQVLANLR